jgi:hypothetical protein
MPRSKGSVIGWGLSYFFWRRLQASRGAAPPAARGETVSE